ncbi:MAG: tyrosine-type recombinase/integrase [Acidimicrobiia bacterium]|nr:tyrosine-type recombinase/integrase [Acidimicrobiia bacterium]
MRLNNNSSQTIRSYKSDVTALLDWVGGREFTDTDTAVRTYLAEIKDGIAPATLNRKVASIRKWGEFHDVILLKGYRCPKPIQPTPRALDDMAMVEKMIVRAHEADRSDVAGVIALQGFAGLRVGEALSLTPESFDLDEMEITVVGKGQKMRRIPLMSKVWFEVERFVATTPPGEKIFTRSHVGMRQWIKRMFAAVGYPSFSSHMLRATAATHLHLSGAPLRVVQEVLGHEDARTTQRYTRAPMEEMRRAMEVL